MSLIKKPANVTVYSSRNSADAYAIRDFLMRSVVQFDWIEVNDEPLQLQSLGLSKVAGAQFPIIVLTNGETLYAPSISEIATRLGWITQPKLLEYDVSIYGAGPAGLSAAVYGASEGLKTILIEREAIGGQAGTSSLIENYMGFPDGISGAALAERARQQAVKFGVEVLLLREGIKASFINSKIYVDLADGNKMIAKANICATGIEYRKLNLQNEEKYLNKGLYYGAGSSEAPMCTNESIFIIGGGNSAGQAALHFSAFAKKVTMIVRGNDLAASLSHYLIKRIKKQNNIFIHFNAAVTCLNGANFLEEIEITDSSNNLTSRQNTSRLFICIGGSPNTDWAIDTGIIRDEYGSLLTGMDWYDKNKSHSTWNIKRAPYYLETSVPGSFAAGDVRYNSIKRVASAVGEGAMAITFVHKYLQEI